MVSQTKHYVFRLHVPNCSAAQRLPTYGVLMSWTLLKVGLVLYLYLQQPWNSGGLSQRLKPPQCAGGNSSPCTNSCEPFGCQHRITVTIASQLQVENASPSIGGIAGARVFFFGRFAIPRNQQKGTFTNQYAFLVVIWQHLWYHVYEASPLGHVVIPEFLFWYDVHGAHHTKHPAYPFTALVALVHVLSILCANALGLVDLQLSSHPKPSTADYGPPHRGPSMMRRVARCQLSRPSTDTPS